MKEYCEVVVKENGHIGRCRNCGKENTRLIKVNGHELDACKSCFLNSLFLPGQFLTGLGIDPVTARIFC
jgi:hypothetical protein